MRRLQLFLLSNHLHPIPMKKIGLLGVGSHCRNEHLPALQYLRDTRGSDFFLQAVCDLNRDAAEAVAADLGSQQVYTDLDTMLSEAGLDGIIAVTPTPLTCDLTCRILKAGVPVLMEKPLGADLAEAEQVVATAARTGTPVMVGMNRRHDPVMRQAADWLRGRKVRYARAVIHRQNRRESGFIGDAALHPVDLLCSLLGPGELDRVLPVGPDCGEAAVVHLKFDGAPVILEILPACGGWEESYLFCGDGFTLHAIPQNQVHLIQGKDKQTFSAPEGPAGRWTTGETAAFLDALAGTAPWSPSPAEVLVAMQLTQQIADAIAS
jgi:predicted dehydrogenase